MHCFLYIKKNRRGDAQNFLHISVVVTLHFSGRVLGCLESRSKSANCSNFQRFLSHNNVHFKYANMQIVFKENPQFVQQTARKVLSGARKISKVVEFSKI